MVSLRLQIPTPKHVYDAYASPSGAEPVFVGLLETLEGFQMGRACRGVSCQCRCVLCEVDDLSHGFCSSVSWGMVAWEPKGSRYNVRLGFFLCRTVSLPCSIILGNHPCASERIAS